MRFLAALGMTARPMHNFASCVLGVDQPLSLCERGAHKRSECAGYAWGGRATGFPRSRGNVRRTKGAHRSPLPRIHSHPPPFAAQKGDAARRRGFIHPHRSSTPQHPSCPSQFKKLDNRNISANIATKRRSDHPRSGAPKTKNRRVETGCAQTFLDAAGTIE